MVVNVHCVMCTPAKAPGSVQQNKSSAQNAEHLLYETFRAVRIGLKCAKNLGRKLHFFVQTFFSQKKQFSIHVFSFLFSSTHNHRRITNGFAEMSFYSSGTVYTLYTVHHCTISTGIIHLHQLLYTVHCTVYSIGQALQRQLRPLSQYKIPREKLQLLRQWHQIFKSFGGQNTHECAKTFS